MKAISHLNLEDLAHAGGGYGTEINAKHKM